MSQPVNLGTEDNPIDVSLSSQESMLDTIMKCAEILDEQECKSDRFMIVPKFMRIAITRLNDIEFNKCKYDRKLKPRNHIYSRYFQRNRRRKHKRIA